MSTNSSFRHYRQLVLHDPDNGHYGDCQRVCLAMVMRRNPEDVPHFGDANLYSREEWVAAEKQWLIEQGYGRVQLPFPGTYTVKQIVSTISANSFNLPVVLMGKSPRGKWNHDVVVFDGKIYDPHPDDQGLAGPCIREGNEEERWYWMTVITNCR